jgi:uncharacterized membrane protein YdfJ with MMPL/SSD domain
MSERFASFVHRNSRRILLVALVGVAFGGVFGLGVKKQMSPFGATDPSTQSVQATNRYQAATGRQIDPGVIALVTTGDVHNASAERRVRHVEAQLRASRDVATASSYYDSHDPAMLSRDGRSTYVVAYFQPKSDLRIQDDALRLERQFAGQHDVELGGEAIASAQANTQVGQDLAHAELLAFPFIFLLSLLFFRSLVASLLPPLLGGLAILSTFFALRIVSSFTGLSVFSLNLVTGLGLGLAIDYSLFMVSRYREESARAGFGVDALRRTLATSGRTIVVSSLTVAAALASLAVFPQNFLYSMGIAGALVALVAATLALVVLPAMLALLGPRVNALAPKRLQRAADRDARPAESGFWYDLEHSLAAHLPIVLALIIASTLIVLFLMTGSLVLGVKAVLMNALSLSAVFGILVLIFQHGNLQGLLSYRSTGALDATQPILLFAIGFGLATDYGVFLLSRVKEAHDSGIPNDRAVAVGLERTGRVVTAAALLFAVAIGAFTTSKLVFIQELGLGTALAVLIDAFVVRALLVPSLMELLGKWNGPTAAEC